MRRALFVAGVTVAAWAAVVSVTGGFSATIAGVRVTSHEPVRPLLIAAGLLAAYAIVSRRGRELLGTPAGAGPPARMPHPAPFVLLLSLVIGIVGIRFGSFAASGSDAYGYVSQSELWKRGSLRIEQPFVSRMPWPFADRTFSPLGYVPAPDREAIVPSYSPGLPMLMAVGRLVSESGPYYIVPIAGALAVWLCYALGRCATAPWIGALAALLVATNPTFLFQLMWPMTDVPVTTAWLAVLYFVCRTKDHDATSHIWNWIGPVCVAFAILIRPNLVPLAAVVLLFLLRSRQLPQALALTVGVVAGSAIVATINASLYGSPFTSGYGDIRGMYRAENFWPNLRSYGGWIAESQTAAIGLAAIGALVPSSHPRSAIHSASMKWLLVAFTLAVLLLYVFYGRWDAWWYLRFLLPAFPAALILMAAGAMWLLRFVPAPARAAMLAFGIALLVSYQVQFAIRHNVFDIAPGEQRYVAAARYVATHLPPSAVVISVQHSGSIRYYSRRLTLRYDWLPPEWLDRALDTLRAEGMQPFILLEDWEEPGFQTRFGHTSRIGKLDWRPMAEFPGPIRVRIYDPDQRRR